LTNGTTEILQVVEDPPASGAISQEFAQFNVHVQEFSHHLVSQIWTYHLKEQTQQATEVVLERFRRVAMATWQLICC
jgi:hypothetical protein